VRRSGYFHRSDRRRQRSPWARQLCLVVRERPGNAPLCHDNVATGCDGPRNRAFGLSRVLLLPAVAVTSVGKIPILGLEATLAPTVRDLVRRAWREKIWIRRDFGGLVDLPWHRSAVQGRLTGLPASPCSGKSGLAYRVARELGLGRVLRWPITSRTTLEEGLYSYDGLGRAQAARARTSAAPDGDEEPSIGEYLRLGELGTAFLPRRLPRVLLIDELDKSEADLPNDLLSLFEDGEFAIPELVRMRRHPRAEVFTADPDATATVVGGRVRCAAFPIVVITSNGDRDFPPAFLRRLLRFEIQDPEIEQSAAMVAVHALDPADAHRSRIIEDFVNHGEVFGGLPVDKLLAAVYLAESGAYSAEGGSWPRLVEALWRQMNPKAP
jgi:hypothetical protein